ncbi:hypothetical protein DFH09DRAFT_1342459 [Mycena vulgaris]|nr:hypothetical protein DFH09DRAFT_1342459 [Mycena vulgaris]
MPSTLSIALLLNPVQEGVDASDKIQAVIQKLSGSELPVDPQVLQHLRHALASAAADAAPAPRTGVARPILLPPPPPQQTVVEHGVRINRQLTVDTFIRHPRGALVEYPQSSGSTEIPVAHLFHMDADPQRWDDFLPWKDFQYSLGTPGRRSEAGKFVGISVLTDARGKEVECVVHHNTCAGVKACQYFHATSNLAAPHTSATLADVQRIRTQQRRRRDEWSLPRRNVFLKTVAYISAVLRLGCRRTLQENTTHEGAELAEFERQKEQKKLFARGHSAPDACEGHIVYDDGDLDRRPSLRCEHFSSRSRNHWVNFTVDLPHYDLDYIAAVFTDDQETTTAIEDAAAEQEYGPRAPCATVFNKSAQRLSCPIMHRVPSGALQELSLVHLPCAARYRMWVPRESARAQCPYILWPPGAHTHPIPFPEKTPRAVRLQLLTLLGNLREDLPDMTPRRFLRHPALKVFLYDKFPLTRFPTLSDLHPSLANRSHLASYIQRVKESNFPVGTGWKAVRLLKEQQDTELPREQHYIRVMLELDDDTLPVHEEDDERGEPGGTKRIIICMSSTGSKRVKLGSSELAFTPR